MSSWLLTAWGCTETTRRLILRRFVLVARPPWLPNTSGCRTASPDVGLGSLRQARIVQLRSSHGKVYNGTVATRLAWCFQIVLSRASVKAVRS